MSAPQQTLDRWADGERLFATALGRLTDEEFDHPSLLPGWDRVELRTALSEATGYSVLMDKDVTSAAVAPTVWMRTTP